MNSLSFNVEVRLLVLTVFCGSERQSRFCHRWEIFQSEWGTCFLADGGLWTFSRTYAHRSAKLGTAMKLQPILRECARRWYGRAVRKKLLEGEHLSDFLVKGKKRRLDCEIIWFLALKCFEASSWKHAGEYDFADMIRGETELIAVSELVSNGQWRVRLKMVANPMNVGLLEREVNRVLAELL